MKTNTLTFNTVLAGVWLIGTYVTAGPAIARDQVTKAAQAEPTRVSSAPWRFRITPYAWLTDIPIEIKTPEVDDSIDLSLGKLLRNARGGLEVSAEARKGPVGFYLETLAIFLKGDKQILDGLAKLEITDNAALLSYGASYELGRWRLGEGAGAPTVAVEPYGGARTLIDHIKVKLEPGPDPDVNLDFTTPFVGLRTFWDLKEPWNLRVWGNYGGFGVDDVHKIWEMGGVVGYRFDIRGTPSNFLFGYRYLHLDYRKSDAELLIKVRGPIIGLSLDF